MDIVIILFIIYQIFKAVNKSGKKDTRQKKEIFSPNKIENPNTKENPNAFNGLKKLIQQFEEELKDEKPVQKSNPTTGEHAFSNPEFSEENKVESVIKRQKVENELVENSQPTTMLNPLDQKKIIKYKQNKKIHLKGKTSLKQMIIYKEILDRPLALRK